ncbi:MAG: hypothetical protein ABJH04_07890 [Cyclobacteriaceae bacterium]
MKQLKITNCSDSLMWYNSKIGQKVDFIREESDCYLSREPSGLINIVLKEDAEIVEGTEEE